MYAEGVGVSIVSVQRNASAALNPLIKSNNLLNNALAMQRALASGSFRGRHAQRQRRAGRVQPVESVRRFWRDVKTPPLEAGLLAGITRELVLELCRDLGLPAEESALHDRDLAAADEAFLTSSTREIVPIVRVDASPVGQGAPGPVTRRLRTAFRTAVAARCPEPAA